MSKVVVTKEKLVAIGDALRDKTEATEAYSLDEMPEVIQGIETGGGADFTINDASYLFYSRARLSQYDNIISLLKDVTNMNSMYYNCQYSMSLDVSKLDTSKVTDMSHMFNNCSKLQSLDMSNFDTSKVTSMQNMFANCKAMTEIIGFSAINKAGVNIGFPYGSTASSKMALNRLTFRTDLPEGTYSIRSAINIKYCSFDREGMVEMFNTLPDITAANVSASYSKITITGNTCVTDGTLTEEDKAIATAKGWTLVI